MTAILTVGYLAQENVCGNSYYNVGTCGRVHNIIVVKVVEKSKNVSFTTHFHPYLSGGCLFSFEYCQHIRPIKSCTLAVTKVTTVIGNGRSLGGAMVKKI